MLALELIRSAAHLVQYPHIYVYLRYPRRYRTEAREKERLSIVYLLRLGPGNRYRILIPYHTVSYCTVQEVQRSCLEHATPYSVSRLLLLIPTVTQLLDEDSPFLGG